jgi:DNA-binding MarR family transcriptional regulator
MLQANELYACGMQPSGADERGCAGAGHPSASGSPVDSVLIAVMSVGRLLRQRAAGDDLDPGSIWLLKTLAGQPMRVTDLAASANLDTSTVSRHVAQMDRAGLVERTPDPADGRAHRVELTPSGRSRLDEAFRRRRALLGRSLRDWDTEDVTAFDRLLSRFVGDVENLTTDLEKA